MVKICASIPAKTTTIAVESIRGLPKPDLIELRLDYAEERIDLAKLRASTSASLIATARLPSHGGHWTGAEVERQSLLLSAAKAGFDYIDVEADSNQLELLMDELHMAGSKVVISRHCLDRALPIKDMLGIHRLAKDAGADVVKIIGTALCPADNLPCLSYLAHKPGNVSFAMGVDGIPSRVLSPLMGGAWTYASAGEAVAPGQPTIESLREAYQLMGVVL